MLARNAWVLILAVLLPTALSACRGVQHADKSGASVRRTVTLRLEMPDAGDAQGRFFAAAVARRAGGSVRVQIDLAGYSSALPANELKLARALEAGREDIGYLPARAWAAAGLPAFEALLAPFVITSERTAQSLADGALAERILATLPRTVVGIGLVPAERRRVLATRSVRTAASFKGLRIRVIDNPQSAADFRALGATPVEGLTSQQVFDRIRRGQVDAVESAAGTILSNGYFNLARNLSAYSVFPKFQSIVVSARAWGKLSSAQRAAIRQAAADTVAVADRQVPAAERTELAQLCQAHVRISSPNARELRELRARVRPVIDALARNPQAKTILAEISALPDSGLRPLASPLPAACRHTGSRPAAADQGAATIPNGVYVMTDTVADWLAGGVIGPDFKKDITYVTTMRNGRWYQTQTPNYPDQGPFSGTYTVHGDRVVFIMTKAGAHGENSVAAPETVEWSYFDGKLRFQIVTVADSGSRVLYTAHPWRKVR
jgi:TRAP-type C4-dicarboxylate transport system substrate-binding protein